MKLCFHEESSILAEKTQSAGIANSLTGDTLANLAKQQSNPMRFIEKLIAIFDIKLEPSNQYSKRVLLNKEYKFMLENFIISSQHELYVCLEEQDDIIDALKFKIKVYKYGYPNDEVGMPNGIGAELYEFNEVFNSTWIESLKKNNQSHPRHLDSLYKNHRHFVIRFKDVTLEVISDKFEIVKLSRKEMHDYLDNQIWTIGNVG